MSRIYNANSECPDRSIGNVHVSHAVWKDWPHVGPSYGIRNRGGKTWRTIDGKEWFTQDPSGRQTIKPMGPILFHGGPMDGLLSEVVCGIRVCVNRGSRK
jgi:hypothetical protein